MAGGHDLLDLRRTQPSQPGEEMHVTTLDRGRESALKVVVDAGEIMELVPVYVDSMRKRKPYSVEQSDGDE